MFSSKLLFIFLLVFISISHAFPTNPVIEKEKKNSSDQDTKPNENIPDKAKTNFSQVVIPIPKTLNSTVTKATTQEEKSQNKENEKITSEKTDVNGGKDSQKTLDDSQKTLDDSQKISQANKITLEDKTNKEPQIEENEVKEEEKITEKSEHQQSEDEVKEKSDKIQTEKVLKDNLNENLELPDDGKKVDEAKPEIENKSPVEDVIPDKETTFKITDKEESKNENQVKEPQLYNPDINISDEKDKIKEENYEEYEDDGFRENIKNNLEKESSISNNPSGYIPNKNLGIIDDANSHFFAYLVTLMVLVVLFYLLFHNKQRIIALMIEGRGSRPSRRGARAKYHKLDNNLEEAMGSLRSGGGASLNNIY